MVAWMRRAALYAFSRPAQAPDCPGTFPVPAILYRGGPPRAPPRPRSRDDGLPKSVHADLHDSVPQIPARERGSSIDGNGLSAFSGAGSGRGTSPMHSNQRPPLFLAEDAEAHRRIVHRVQHPVDRPAGPVLADAHHSPSRQCLPQIRTKPGPPTPLLVKAPVYITGCGSVLRSGSKTRRRPMRGPRRSCLRSGRSRPPCRGCGSRRRTCIRRSGRPR